MIGPDVIRLWEEVTGEKWRLVPYLMTSQASEFARAGFTEADLRLVIEYTRRMIAREEGGFNAQSVTWRVMAADQWQKFQERLAAARKTKLARRFYGQPCPVSAPQSSAEKRTPAEEDRIRREGAAALAKFRHNGGR